MVMQLPTSSINNSQTIPPRANIPTIDWLHSTGLQRTISVTFAWQQRASHMHSDTLVSSPEQDKYVRLFATATILPSNASAPVQVTKYYYFLVYILAKLLL